MPTLQPKSRTRTLFPRKVACSRCDVHSWTKPAYVCTISCIVVRKHYEIRGFFENCTLPVRIYVWVQILTVIKHDIQIGTLLQRGRTRAVGLEADFLTGPSTQEDSLTVNDDQKDATVLAYLFIPDQLYMFRAMSSPIIRSTWLYLQLLILNTDTAACRRQYRWTISEAVNTVECSWWWAKTLPETCRADQE